MAASGAASVAASGQNSSTNGAPTRCAARSPSPSRVGPNRLEATTASVVMMSLSAATMSLCAAMMSLYAAPSLIAATIEYADSTAGGRQSLPFETTLSLLAPRSVDKPMASPRLVFFSYRAPFRHSP